MRIKMKAPQEPSIKKDLQSLFDEYEAAEKEALALVEANPAIFSRLEELDDIKEAAKERMKRLVAATREAPSFLRGKKLWQGAAQGDLLKVDITYKKRRDSYDPAKLPKHVLSMQGVIAEVDAQAIEAILEGVNEVTKKAIEKARIPGEWMTPSLSVNRNK